LTGRHLLVKNIEHDSAPRVLLLLPQAIFRPSAQRAITDLN